ncbi:tRNA(His) guanylyltransferase [Rhizoctonia solani AG-1 IB]|uniref:tRNA(His) guanylyltransferase n=1 Tax=Thanatephorus cucumeris (strain AG1-IB / isolate 7/3/14) TaxID=1108050 RepID=M5BX25_THACB|nr:tRNA(His) guanylyltransferase [Rhizoctonia solani AG-1 IB]
MLTSLFTSAYVFNWKTYFPDTELKYPPSFDGRVVIYPGKQEIRDYFSWRQADTHINNLYNTTFWALVQQGGMTAREAETRLKGTLSKDKHEILFSNYGINYNTLLERFKKGSIIVMQNESAGVAIPSIPKESTNNTDVSDPVINFQNVQDAIPAKPESKKIAKNKAKRAPPTTVNVIHVDIIKDEFWTARPELLDS